MNNLDFEADSKKFAAKIGRKVVHADDKPNYHRNKLLGGLLRIGFVIFFLNKFSIHWNEQASPFLKEKISAVIGEETGNFLALSLVAIGHIILLVMFIKGVYKVLTFNQYVDVFEGKNLAGFEIDQGATMHGSSKTSSTSSNIDKAYAYRDSKMAYMTPEKASELYIKTSKLGGSSNKQVDGYINSKLGGMTPEKGLDYLKGK